MDTLGHFLTKRLKNIFRHNPKSTSKREVEPNPKSLEPQNEHIRENPVSEESAAFPDSVLKAMIEIGAEIRSKVEFCEAHQANYIATASHPVRTEQAPEINANANLEGNLTNYRLPFDILTRVFEEVHAIETEEYPLERILAVCRFWRDAALDHQVLWTKFNVYIHNSESIKVWKDRLRRHSDRCGTNTLWDITIALVNRPEVSLASPGGVYPLHKFVKNTREPAYAYLGILKVFAGKHGAKALRWRSLTLDFLNLTDPYNIYDHIIDRFLQHRTPNLETLSLYGVNTEYGNHKMTFPYAPRLQNATFHSCLISNYPDTSNLTSLTWYAHQTELPSQNSRVIHALSTPNNLIYLEIGLDWPDWYTPLLFPRVETLMMPHVVNVSLLVMLRVPSLRHLGLGLDEEGLFSQIADFRGLPCEQVGVLDIFYAAGSTVDETTAHTVIFDKWKGLMDRMVSVRTLSWDQDMAKRQELLRRILAEFTGEDVAAEVSQTHGRVGRSI